MSQPWLILVRFPILIGILIVLAQTLPVLDSRWLWFSDEVRYAEVYSNLIKDGHWIVLNLNGEAYPDKPPLYFLFLALLDMIPGVDMPDVLWLGSSISAIILLFAMRALANAVGITPQGFATGMLVQLSLFGMILLMHYVRMDLLFVAFMMAGQAYLHRYYYNSEASRYAYIGFVFAGLAVLVKGPLGLVLPLAAVWGTTLWAGRGRSILRMTTLLSLLACILVMSSWAAGIIVVEGWTFFQDQIIGEQVIRRATDTFHHSEPFSYYFIMMPLLLLPWTGLVASLPWRRILHWPSTVWAGRSQPGPVGILGMGAFLHFAVLSALDGKVAVYVLPILVQLSLVLGALLATRSLARGWIGVAFAFVSVGLGLIVMSFGADAVAYQAGARICGAVLIGIGLMIWFVRKSAQSALMAVSASMVVWSLLFAGLMLPGLNESTSTRITSEHLGRLAKEGYLPIAYRTYPGIFSYYAGRNVVQVNSAEELRSLVASQGMVVIAGRKRHLDELGLEGFELIDSRVINGAGGRYVVLAGDGVPADG